MYQNEDDEKLKSHQVIYDTINMAFVGKKNIEVIEYYTK